jgi:hypothetical protein
MERPGKTHWEGYPHPRGLHRCINRNELQKGILEMYQRKEVAGEVVEMYQNRMFIGFIRAEEAQQGDFARGDCEYHDVW